jgi:hypothetical protein
MLVFIMGTAEAVVSADVEPGDAHRISHQIKSIVE